MVDRAALEMRSTRKRTGGSNPSLSATLLFSNNPRSRNSRWRSRLLVQPQQSLGAPWDSELVVKLRRSGVDPSARPVVVTVNLS